MGVKKEEIKGNGSDSTSIAIPQHVDRVGHLENKGNHRLHIQATKMTFDKITANVTRSIDETRSELLHYTGGLSNYQEQIIEDCRKAAEYYFEAQKELVVLFQSEWDPYIRTNDDGINYFYYWVLPKLLSEAYSNMIDTILTCVLTPYRLTNHTIVRI